ncbi:hypothetical protein QQS45_03670 [Alteriqipengyuania flavescens]|uniref:hypothetical protein n=1 Tax=Alteriqipengyuania flavescens TaxID=3053610 RepID=UPI0025B37BF2|nr:hypothetical protein [Alteriqipengyuania flavescens]WJY19342.1 hypothetical protein QQW98_03665 [Alteriqipengyuania flavescens]WJY25283.1 hypothetical protein QQS45_03670 [Alteriqipengyuania flavescens]
MADFDDFQDDFVVPRDPSKIDMWELAQALSGLILFDDTYLRMQGTNVALIDRWLMDLESQVGARLAAEDRTPIDDAMFLNAFSQMWMFAAYELLRTWRQRAKDCLKWIDSGGVDQKIASLKEDRGYINFGKAMRASQLEALKKIENASEKIRDDLRRVHIPFTELEVLRVSLAKHEVRGKPNMPFSAPGYARIDRMTGSLSYELGGGRVILGYRTRREISDGLRAIPNGPPPTEEEIKDFDEFMKELGSEAELPLADMDEDQPF